MGLTVLVLGSGRSSTSLISYLKENRNELDLSITVGDLSFKSIDRQPWGMTTPFDITNVPESLKTIRTADLVISMIPASLHGQVAKICLSEKKHLITASYVSDEMNSYGKEAAAKGLLFLNECGLDPGIDHMSAMQVIDRIKKEGGKMTSFESFTGGLIAPETDPQNPWRYKFTWNPRNVVLAGQGTSRYLREGQYKFIPYHQLFNRITPVSIPGHGDYDGYANRDSLKYLETYGLESVHTMLRGTLRFKGYCQAWNVFVQLGCTEDTYDIPHADRLTHREFLNFFLTGSGADVVGKLMQQLNLKPDGPEIERLRWSGLFDDELVGLPHGTPAKLLEHILSKKWKLKEGDKDLVVMWHRFRYQQNGRDQEIQSSLVVKGENSVDTAMARTVGLPIGIAARLLLEGKIKSRGVVIPTVKEIYEPVLRELATKGIALEERAT